MDVGRFGRAVRAIRVRRGWRQEDLAGEARLGRSVIGRIERGEPRGLTLEALEAVATALGGTAELRMLWHGEELDESHARLVDVVVRRLRDLGWDVAVEVTFSRYGERGSIDVMAFHPVRRALLVVEVKSVTPDMQAMLGGIDRKARLAPALAVDRGWDADVVARVLVIWDTRTNRRRLDAHAASVRAQLPAGSREVQRWVRDPTGPAVSGVWFVPDVRRGDGTRPSRHRVRLRRS